MQSPTDYRFVTEVIGEKAPYYAYASIRPHDDWLQRKMGRLCLRLANHLQPHHVYDATATMADYVSAGCKKAVIDCTPPQGHVDMAILRATQPYEHLRHLMHDGSVLVCTYIHEAPQQWEKLLADNTFNVTFDLYYCGIAIADKHRSANHYIVNF